MDILNILIIIVLIAIFIKQILCIRRLKVATIKSTSEVVTVALCVVALIVLAYFFAKSYLHYLLTLMGVILFITIWLKQGISDSGLYIVARNKDTFTWNDIESVEIKTGDSVIVGYHMKSIVSIISQKYKIENYTKLLKIFEDNNVKVITK